MLLLSVAAVAKGLRHQLSLHDILAQTQNWHMQTTVVAQATKYSRHAT